MFIKFLGDLSKPDRFGAVRGRLWTPRCTHRACYGVAPRCPFGPSGVFALSRPTSRSGHSQKPFRNTKNLLFRRFWGFPGGHTGRVTGVLPVASLPARGSPSSDYTPLELKLILNSTRRKALSVIPVNKSSNTSLKFLVSS